MNLSKLLVTNAENTVTYDLAFMSAESADTMDVVLITDDIHSVKNDFANIHLIEIINTEGLITFSSTDYCTIFNTLELISDYWLDPESDFYYDGVKIKLKKINLEEKWKRLDAQINPVIDESGMSLEEYRVYQIQKLGKLCEAAIFRGTDVTLENGSAEHFSYDLKDQLNILELFHISSSTNLPCPYHIDKNPCAIYSVSDVRTIYITLAGHKLYHTTYANALNTYIRSLEDKSKIAEVVYGIDVPEACRTYFDAAIAQGQKVIQAVIENE